jgi:predicted glycoside hydrolase/deacetylase ChbG (UPF0249 family)
VTADDFGFGVATSRGIIRAHQAGVVTSTSLMAVTSEHVEKSIALLADSPRLEVGLHLVVSGEGLRPLAAGRSSGMVGRDGGFLPLPKMLARAFCRRVCRSAVFDEICAQAERARTLLGRSPAYVDGHHHAHQLPVVREALVDSIERGILPSIVRSTIEPPEIRQQVSGERLRRGIMHRLGTRTRPIFQRAGIRTNDACFGIIGAKQLAQPLPWASYLPHLPKSGVIEWFVHPGEMDPSLQGRDCYIQQRAMELQALVRLAEHPDWPRWSAVLTTQSAGASQPLEI